MSYKYGELEKLNDGLSQSGRNAFGFPHIAAYIDDDNSRIFSGRYDGVTPSAMLSQNSSKSFAGLPLLFAAMIVALIAPIDVPATTSSFMPNSCTALYTPHS